MAKNNLKKGHKKKTVLGAVRDAIGSALCTGPDRGPQPVAVSGGAKM